MYLSIHIFRNRGQREIFRKCFQPKPSITALFPHFLCKAPADKPFKLSFARWFHDIRKRSIHRCHASQASLLAKSETEKQTKTHFQELLDSRKQQAHRSVLLHITEKENVPYAVAKCEQFGNVSNAYYYSGEKNNCFVLLEFSTEAAIQDLFKNCQHQYTNDGFPVFSRIVQFQQQSNTNLPKVKVELQEGYRKGSSAKADLSISEIIEDIYSYEKLTEFDIRLRHFYCTVVKDSVSSFFPHCDVLPFGSSVNGIGRRGCDLDAMIKLYPEKENIGHEFVFLNKACSNQKAMQQKVVNVLGDFFHTFLPGVMSVRKVLSARMPIIKMKHRILKMDCDLSINNMSAILMSDVVHFFGEVDHRFRPLLFTVKKWAREAELTHDKPGTTMTNFGLTTLLVYFFQMEQILPTLNDALVIVGEDNTPGFHLQYLKSIEEWKSLASQNVKSPAQLFIDFLFFLAEYPFEGRILSLMSGKFRPHSEHVPLWLQYPFDEDLNIMKNISDYEFSVLRSIAEITAKSLEKNVDQKINVKDFSVLFGLPETNGPKKVMM